MATRHLHQTENQFGQIWNKLRCAEYRKSRRCIRYAIAYCLLQDLLPNKCAIKLLVDWSLSVEFE